MTTMFTVVALLERLRDLFPDATPKIEHLLANLKHIRINEDAYRNVTNEQAKAIMDVSHDLEHQIESYVREVASRRDGFLNRIFKGSSEQVKVIENLLQTVADKITQLPKPADTSPGPKHHGPEIVKHRILPSRAALAEDTKGIVGMEDAKNKLVSDLTSGASQLTLVSICGMIGIGKTAMATELFRSPVILHRFDCLAWIGLSQEHQTRDILQEIFSGISNGKDAVDLNQDELAERIYKSLKGRRYLIVLDDLWSADTQFSLRMVFPDDNNGSRILITTRREDVARQAGSVIHPMRPLTPDESWALLRRTVGLDDTQVHPQIEKIGRQIARRSEGLPLSIVVLRLTPFQEWGFVLHNFSWISMDELFETLNLSCKTLPPHLMPCLLYLGTFPDDAEIEMDTLLQIWIAEGLVSMEDKGNGETMMDVAARYLDELQKRSFIQHPEGKVSGQSKSFRIGHLMRDFCRRKGKEDDFFDVIDLGDKNNEQPMSFPIRRAIYLDEYEYTHSYLYETEKHLRSLLFFSTSKSGTGIIRPREIPNLDDFLWVRVLSLYDVDFKYGKFPKGVEKLVYLRYLSFRECYLEELSSSVGNMLYLQTLDLRIRNECELIIPNVLNNLKRLKYLYFPLAYRTHDRERLNLDRLTGLEILVNFDPGLCYHGIIEHLTNLNKLAVTTNGDVSYLIRQILEFTEKLASHLRSLSLNIRNFHCHSERRFSVVEKVFNCSALHALEVRGYLRELPKLDKINDLNLTQLVLNSSAFAEDPMQILQMLPKLRILVLEVEAYIGKNMKCFPFGFPELRYLKLSKLYNLEEWEVEVQAMPKLCTVVIENCKKLTMLPDGLQFVTELEKLEIASMPDEFVCRIRNTDGTKGDDFYKIERAYPNVKIDGRPLIVQERQQAGPREDPQSSS